MRKVYKVENIDCAHCAAKMEEAANKLAGVEKVTLNFLTKKLIVEADESNFANIVDEIEKVMKKVDFEAEIVR